MSGFAEVIKIDRDRCVRLRHKWSKCDECMQACPTGAIKVGNVGGAINIEWYKCNGCGICSNVCKTGVYTLKDFSDKGFLDRCRGVVLDCGKLEVRCKKVNDGTGNYDVVVECLGIINPAHILGIIASGAEAVHFRYDTCNNCKSRYGEAVLQRAINATEGILNIFGSGRKVVITAGSSPAGFVPLLKDRGNSGKKKETEKKEMLSRRELFSYFKKQTQFSAVKTFDVFLEAEQKSAAQRIDYSGKLPVKRVLMLTFLREMGEITKNTLNTSDNALMSGLEIDRNKCDMCGICYKFCPTGALTEHTAPDESGAVFKAGINFRPAYCVKCDLCIAACFQKAIKYTDALNMASFIECHELPIIRV